MRQRTWTDVGTMVAAMLMVLVMGVMIFMASGTEVANGDEPSTSTQAVSTVGTKADTGTITVAGIEDSSTSLTVTAYPIVLAYYSSNGYFSDYVGLYDTISTVLSASGTGTVSFTLEQLEAVKAIIDDSGAVDLDDFTSYIFGDSAADSYVLTKNTDDTYSADVAIGSYLIVIENADTVVYNLAVVSSFYDVDEVSSEGYVNNGTVDITNGTTWVKAAEPDVEKYIVEDSEEVKGNSANIGDIETFEIVVDPIPYYTDTTGVTFKVTDTMDGLEYVADSLHVYVYEGTALKAELVRNDHFDANTVDDPNEFWVSFVVSGEYTLNDYAGMKLVITYQAEITEDANINEDANTNTATIQYSTDSGVTSDSDTTYTYTFDIDGTVTANIITKTGESQSELLSGAVFAVYTDQECTTLYTNDVFDGYVTSDDKGQLYITGLEAGTDYHTGNYYIKEYQAPDGYTLNTTVYRIRVYAEYDVNGKLTKWQILVNGVEGATFTVVNDEITKTYINTIYIANTKTKGLPSTGGYGTLIFTLIGCVVMIISAGFYLRCREKKVK